MADKCAGYVVCLEADLPSEQADRVLAALSMIKGVIAVEPVVTTAQLHTSKARALTELENKLLDIILK